MLTQIVEGFGKDLDAFKEIARKRYLSWQNHPEYFEALDRSYQRLKEHAATLKPEIGLKLLEVVLENRFFNEVIYASYRAGKFKGALLRNLGQEAVGVGVGVAMRPYDTLAREHRSIGATIARGTPIIDFMRNHLMRSTGPSGGYDPNIHFADIKRHDLGFMASDMATASVLVNGGVWYLNAKRTLEKGSALDPTERSAGVALFGDGAASNGIAHAGMNFAKAWNLPVVFVILNNQISLRTSAKEQHGGIELSNRGLAFEMPVLRIDGDNAFAVYLATWLFLDFARETNHPTLIHALTFRRAGHNDTEGRDYEKKIFDPQTYEFWHAREQDPLYKTRTACQELGFIASDSEYEKLRDAVKAKVEAAYQTALGEPEPTPENFRSSLIDPECKVVNTLANVPSVHSGGTTEMSFKEALQKAFREELVYDPLLIMLGEDIGYPGGGVFGVTGALVEEFRDRIRNATLDEAAIAGFLISACLFGGKAIAEYQFWNFFLAGASLPLTIAATRPFMQQIGVSGVLRGPTYYAPQSNHYHETSPETYLLKALGIKVVVPSTPEDAYGLMKSAIRDPDLVAVLEEMSYYSMTGPVRTDEYFTPFKAAVRKPGKDITLVTWGPKMLNLALASQETLAKQGIDLEIIDLRILRPWDKETVFESLQKTGRLIILHEDSKFMGFGAEISASVAEDPAFYKLKARIIRVAALDTPIPGHLVLEDYRLPSIEKVVTAAKTLMGES